MNNTHFHKRNLPHFYRQNSTYFITYRLKNSIPINILKELRERKEFNKAFKSKAEKYKSDKKFFAEYDNILDKNSKIQFLKEPKVARIVCDSLHFYDKKEYGLICYTVMPNHVHLVFHLLEETQIGKSVLQNQSQIRKSASRNVTQTFQSERVSLIMKSIKGYSALESNKIVNRKGSFWQSESYDHIVRDEDELLRIIKYVIYNPVKAGLVEKWEDWKFTYLAEEW